MVKVHRKLLNLVIRRYVDKNNWMAFAGRVSTRRKREREKETERGKERERERNRERKREGRKEKERERKRGKATFVFVEHKLCLYLLQFAYANGIAGTRDYDELTVYERLKLLKVCACVWC